MRGTEIIEGINAICKKESHIEFEILFEFNNLIPVFEVYNYAERQEEEVVSLTYFDNKRNSFEAQKKCDQKTFINGLDKSMSSMDKDFSELYIFDNQVIDRIYQVQGIIYLSVKKYNSLG